MFAVVFSLVALPGPLSSLVRFPTIPSVGAIPAPCPTFSNSGTCSEFWYPAGPESNTLSLPIYASQAAEYSSLAAGAIDMMDQPLTPTQVTCLTSGIGCLLNPSNYFVTAPVPVQFGYLSYWQRVINGVPGVGTGPGTPNFFTWLNAYSTGSCIPGGCNLPILPASPPLTCPSAGCIRQALLQPTAGFSLNPYLASPGTVQDFYILNNIYDSLYRTNPLNNLQYLDWMETSAPTVIPAASCGYSLATLPGTTDCLRNFLRFDISWHDNQQISAFDVAFTYLSMVAAFNMGFAPQLPPELQCPSITCIVTGITVLGNHQFDIDLSVAPSSLQVQHIGSITIIPGHKLATAWIGNCAPPSNCYPSIYPMTGNGGGCSGSPCLGPVQFPTLNNAKLLPAYDPLMSGDLIGSGPWVCANTNPAFGPVGTPGTGCSSNDTSNPGLGFSFTLTRFGCSLSTNSCADPSSSPSALYFRSSGRLAMYFWTGMTGVLTTDVITISQMASCYFKAVGTAGCTPWQEGIGNPGCPIGGAPTCFVRINQLAIAAFYFDLTWIGPFATDPAGWSALTGIGSFRPILYEETSVPLVPPYTLNPTPIAGCALPTNGPPLVAGYPNGGGYNC